MNGLETSIIKEKMNLTDNQYNKLWQQIKSFENTYELYANNNGSQEEEEDMGSVQTLEKKQARQIECSINHEEN